MVVVLKVGGSVLTFKDRRERLNPKGLRNVAEALKGYGSPLVLVHGGGSFGHYYAELYGFGVRPSFEVNGIGRIRASMLRLNAMLVEELAKSGIECYTIQPVMLGRAKHLILRLLRDGLIPVSFGDVVPSRAGYKILSGDDIVLKLSKLLKPERVVFAMDVNGVYRRLGGELLKEVRLGSEVGFSKGGFDVTGGLKRKLSIAFRIAKMGVDVRFVSGLKSGELLKALKGEEHLGTLVRV